MMYRCILWNVDNNGVKTIHDIVETSLSHKSVDFMVPKILTKLLDNKAYAYSLSLEVRNDDGSYADHAPEDVRCAYCQGDANVCTCNLIRRSRLLFPRPPSGLCTCGHQKRSHAHGVCAFGSMCKCSGYTPRTKKGS